MLLTLIEIRDILAITIIVGVIFSDFFKKLIFDFYTDFEKLYTPNFQYKLILYSAAVIAPAIILHEFGHKFTAMAFGMSATFNAAYGWLFFALVMKLIGFNFIIFVPAYVSWGPTSIATKNFLIANPIIGSIIALSGPFVNILLYFGAKYYLDNIYFEKKKIKARRPERFNYKNIFFKENQDHFNQTSKKNIDLKYVLISFFMRINLFLAIFNLIPIPGFDGFHVISGILKTLF